MTLESAIDAIVADTQIVSKIRSDDLVRQLINSFKKSSIAQFDEEGIHSELADMAMDVAFNTKGFSLSGTTGIKDAKDSRLKLQAVRSRLLELSRELRKNKLKAEKALRAGRVYLRDHGLLDAKTAKHSDDIADVALREIVDAYESIKYLLNEIRETNTLVESKTRELDAWFLLHKQYIFVQTNRGPRGEQETFDQASKHRRPGPSSRNYSDDDFDDD